MLLSVFFLCLLIWCVFPCLSFIFGDVQGIRFGYVLMIRSDQREGQCVIWFINRGLFSPKWGGFKPMNLIIERGVS
ncbi:hypothetical protein BDV40DRAFT_269727 [Aspergillus tamarii]|uniref:Secreted protein n=1 Tax=Aspergillus tamarii TaxID=41984 RepID=A0A5N6UPV3_ASPTM|nr:hypothetical protein BDV40DRAFT_269727 [Aspergillus tamarii]